MIIRTYGEETGLEAIKSVGMNNRDPWVILCTLKILVLLKKEYADPADLRALLSSSDYTLHGIVNSINKDAGKKAGSGDDSAIAYMIGQGLSPKQITGFFSMAGSVAGMNADLSLIVSDIKNPLIGPHKSAEKLLNNGYLKTPERVKKPPGSGLIQKQERQKKPHS